MKKIISLFITFVVSFAVLDIIGATSYMIYFDCMHFVVGTDLEFFNFSVLLQGLIYGIPFSAIVSVLLICFFTIRHGGHHWINFGMYIFCVLLTWAVIVPLSFMLSNKYFSGSTDISVEEAKSFVSPGYFRQADDDVYFFQDITDDKASGIVIRNGKIQKADNVDTYETFHMEKNSDAYDPLVNATLNPPFTIHVLFVLMNEFLETADYSYRGKGLYLIAFLSFALALSSVYGFSKVSKWRLCNGCFVFSAFVVICMVNLGIYTSPITAKLITFFMNKNLTVLTDYGVLQIIANSVFFLIALIVGIVKAVKNPHANEEYTE